MIVNCLNLPPSILGKAKNSYWKEINTQSKYVFSFSARIIATSATIREYFMHQHETPQSNTSNGTKRKQNSKDSAGVEADDHRIYCPESTDIKFYQNACWRQSRKHQFEVKTWIWSLAICKDSVNTLIWHILCRAVSPIDIQYMTGPPYPNPKWFVWGICDFCYWSPVFWKVLFPKREIHLLGGKTWDLWNHQLQLWLQHFRILC